MFREYDIFRLAKALPGENIPIGTVGVVLIEHGGTPPAFEVEFPDGAGGNLGSAMTYTVTGEFMVAADVPVDATMGDLDGP
jgi:hypothetical protein